jgi:uncharacterized protein
LRFVFDTNVLISASLLPSSKPRRALDLAIKQGKLLLSYPVLAELCEVLSRERFRRYIDEEDIRTFVAVLTREAEWVDVDMRITACRDPKDDKFLELAVSGRGTCIVSGDSDLLVLSPFQGILIMTPQTFLEQ